MIGIPSISRRRRAGFLKRGFLVGLLAFGMTGCKTGHIKDPNDPADVGRVDPSTLRGNLQTINESLALRLARREITKNQYRELTVKAAVELMTDIETTTIREKDAWQYGEILKNARRWKQAETTLRMAVEFAIKTKNDDRRVNDSLRLATVLGELKRPKEAIKMARSVFDAPPNQLAPILLGVYLEIVPATRNQGQDAELAQLIAEAIDCHRRVVVDKNTDAGHTFEIARNFHIARAYGVMQGLYRGVGREDLASALEKPKQESMTLSRR